MNKQFARRMERFLASDLTPILKAAANPEIISFAGGLPAPELFPVEEYKKIAAAVLDKDGRRALQYSSSAGHLPLRQKVAERTSGLLKTPLTENIVSPGFQQSGHLGECTSTGDCPMQSPVPRRPVGVNSYALLPRGGDRRSRQVTAD